MIITQRPLSEEPGKSAPPRMRFRTFGPRITAEMLVSVERRLDVRLPHDYRAFLMTRNGGELDDMYVVGPSEPDVGVEEFLSVGPVAGVSDLVAATERWRSLARGTGWAETLVVIAECVGGTLLLIDPDDGQIYRWDDRDPDQFAAVADSFVELLQTLVRVPDEDPVGVESIWIDPAFARELAAGDDPPPDPTTWS